jgi:hypothetical protein
MALVALASLKGAPGVTTTAMALAATWPAQRRAVVVEFDAAGGDLAAQHGLAAEPSLVSLAAAARRDRGRGDVPLSDHSIELPGGRRVVAGTASPSEMTSAVEALADVLPGLADHAGVDVLADCGRLDSASLTSAVSISESTSSPPPPLFRLLGAAELVIVVSRGTLADLSHVEAWLPTLRALNDSVSLLLVGALSWRADEVCSALGAVVIDAIPDDRTGAEVIAGASHRGNGARLPLLRAARRAADRMAGQLPELRPTSADASPTVTVDELDVIASEVAG